MRCRSIFTLAILVAAAPETARGQITVPEIPVTAVVESESVPAGGTLRVAAVVDVPRGLHLQSDRPRDPSLIAARLAIETPDGIQFVDVAYPPSTDFRLIGFDELLAVFEGRFAVGARLAINKAFPPGAVTVPATFRYQACDDTLCFPPKTVPMTFTFAVSAPGAPAVPTDSAAIFEGIDFSRAYSPEPPVTASAKPPATPPENIDVVTRFDRFTILGAAQYADVDEFMAFIDNAEKGIKPAGLFDGRGPLAILAIVFLGGLALNLTPCVLPMIPINLAIIGAGAKSGRRGRGFLLGSAYGAAMAVVYGVLGLGVILTAGTFGSINASPWFNLGIAALFVFLGLAMFDVVSLDFSRWSSRIRFSEQSRGTVWLAFGMGAVAALLAGACVAPVVVQVVVFASNLYAGGSSAALALPFVLGLGMALPWPIAGAGVGALPKPGAWMVRVKQVMGIFILATAAYYAYVGYGILASRWVDPREVQASAEAQLKSGWHSSLQEGLIAAERNGTPVLVDFWATWCKNCLVMDQTTLKDPAVLARLAGYTKIKYQAEDPEASPSRELLQRVGSVGLPTYVILRPPAPAASPAPTPPARP
jgi:cytochrome c biogenesis protein CcdA